ncbi:MAG TPA: fumarylacetoacetate hydrolase family protein [Acidimicrobiales bacterium]|nr:fumarylacetoacetate hydrolase family protein [Acidimicrobiales bacterium]
MRFVTFRDPGTGSARAGVVDGANVRALAAGESLIDHLGDLAGVTSGDEVFALEDLTLLSPIPTPTTVRDFYAFEQHVRTARKKRGLEMDPDWYELPVFYFSNPYAVNGPGAEIAIPPGSVELDFELEVAAVIGKAGSDLSPTEAEDHIAGFTIMNDWSARDVQRREMKLSMGPVKGKDFATTLGPYLITPDELEESRKGRAYDLAMVARVNGKEYSRASLADIFWGFGEMIAYASRGTRVEVGDIIGPGTCGTGCILELSLVHGGDAFPYLKPGDEVELEVDQLGVLANRVVEGAPLRPLR